MSDTHLFFLDADQKWDLAYDRTPNIGRSQCLRSMSEIDPEETFECG